MKLKRLFMVGAMVAAMCGTASAATLGDVDGNGEVDIADVNAVINIMLGRAEQTPAADLTGNGEVDIADVNMVINVMLGKVTPEQPGDGIREGSAQQLFEVELKALYEELDANAIHPTVATVGDYVVVCLGDGRTPVYVNKATGEKLGEIALGEAVPTGSVTSDENGNLVIANWADGQGSNFCLWKIPMHGASLWATMCRSSATSMAMLPSWLPSADSMPSTSHAGRSPAVWLILRPQW